MKTSPRGCAWTIEDLSSTSEAARKNLVRRLRERASERKSRAIQKHRTEQYFSRRKSSAKPVDVRENRGTPTWIYGKLPLRNGLFYGINGRHILYVSREHLIKYDPVGHTQTFISTNPRVVSAFTVSNDGRVAAIGCSGKRSDVFVWSTRRRTLLVRLQGQRGGIQRLALSCDNTMVASVGADKKHTLMIHSVSSGMRLTKKFVGAPVRALTFDPSGTRLCVVCTNGVVRVLFLPNPEKGIKIWKMFKANSRELYAGDVPREASTIGVTFAGGAIVLCTRTKGVWTLGTTADASASATARRLDRGVVDSPINVTLSCADVAANAIVVGCASGCVLKIDVRSLRTRTLFEAPSAVLGLCYSSTTRRILVDTAHSGVWELVPSTGEDTRDTTGVYADTYRSARVLNTQAVGSYHATFRRRVSMLFMCNRRYVSAWNDLDRRLQRIESLPEGTDPLALAAHRDVGHVVMCALDAARRVEFRVYRTDDLALVRLDHIEFSTLPSIARYAPDGSVLAIGTRGGAMLLLSVAEKYTKRALLRNPGRARVLSVQFSEDSTRVRSVHRDSGAPVLWDIRRRRRLRESEETAWSYPQTLFEYVQSGSFGLIQYECA